MQCDLADERFPVRELQITITKMSQNQAHWKVIHSLFLSENMHQHVCINNVDFSSYVILSLSFCFGFSDRTFPTTLSFQLIYIMPCYKESYIYQRNLSALKLFMGVEMTRQQVWAT